MDADGFSVEDNYAGDAFNKIPAKSTKRLLDRALIDIENAPQSSVFGWRSQRTISSCLSVCREYPRSFPVVSLSCLRRMGE